MRQQLVARVDKQFCPRTVHRQRFDGATISRELSPFDNSASRRLVREQCRALSIPCLHVGLFKDYGEVIWDECYRVPQDVAGDVCDYPLARNLVLLTVAVASEVVLRFVLEGARQDWSATLRDFAVRPLESPA